MFIYERNGKVCVSLDALPTDVPAYTIDIDQENKTISVNGVAINPATQENNVEKPVEVEPTTETVDEVQEEVADTNAEETSEE